MDELLNVADLIRFRDVTVGEWISSISTASSISDGTNALETISLRRLLNQPIFLSLAVLLSGSLVLTTFSDGLVGKELDDFFLQIDDECVTVPFTRA